MIERILRRIYNKAVVRTAIHQGMRIGKNVRFLGNHNFGSEPYLIEIGDNVTVSTNVLFINHDGGTAVFKRCYSPEYDSVIKYGRIIIHDNCFIGASTILMPGIEIGPNAVIGAGSVVTKNVLPNTVVAGSPIKVICTIEEYAKKCSDKCPKYDLKNYQNNKRREIENIL